MIRTRVMAAAMLFHGGELLMMKRSMQRTISPGKWAAVGGHVEPEEIGDPRSAVLREIHEETGFTPGDIQELKLQYILIRLNGQEIRHQYFYTGYTAHKETTQTDEGDLHWIPLEHVLDREIPFIYRSLLQYHFDHGTPEHIIVGTAGLNSQQEPVIHWTELIDPIVV